MPTLSKRPAPPKNLKGEARAEWFRIVKELESIDQGHATDRALLTLYCRVWQRWQAAEAEVEKRGIMMTAKRSKVLQHNPYLQIANRAHWQAARLLTEMGLTPAARLRKARGQEARADESIDLDLD